MKLPCVAMPPWYTGNRQQTAWNLAKWRRNLVSSRVGQFVIAMLYLVLLLYSALNPGWWSGIEPTVVVGSVAFGLTLLLSIYHAFDYHTGHRPWLLGQDYPPKFIFEKQCRVRQCFFYCAEPIMLLTWFAAFVMALLPKDDNTQQQGDPPQATWYVASALALMESALYWSTADLHHREHRVVKEHLRNLQGRPVIKSRSSPFPVCSPDVAPTVVHVLGPLPSRQAPRSTRADSVASHITDENRRAGEPAPTAFSASRPPQSPGASAGSPNLRLQVSYASIVGPGPRHHASRNTIRSNNTVAGPSNYPPASPRLPTTPRTPRSRVQYPNDADAHSPGASFPSPVSVGTSCGRTDHRGRPISQSSFLMDDGRPPMDYDPERDNMLAEGEEGTKKKKENGMFGYL